MVDILHRSEFAGQENEKASVADFGGGGPASSWVSVPRRPLKPIFRSSYGLGAATRIERIADWTAATVIHDWGSARVSLGQVSSVGASHTATIVHEWAPSGSFVGLPNSTPGPSRRKGAWRA